ncbi:hypothetical protein D3C76_1410140 [compost metagenome]
MAADGKKAVHNHHFDVPLFFPWRDYVEYSAIVYAPRMVASCSLANGGVFCWLGALFLLAATPLEPSLSAYFIRTVVTARCATGGYGVIAAVCP